MGLKNLIILGLLIWAGAVLWRRWKLASRRPPAAGHGGRMVKCDECGVYVPEGETVARGADHRVCLTHSSRPRG